MPELPEVETFVRGLNKISGRTITALDVLDEVIVLSAKDVVGKTIKAISRRGKYIIVQLCQGSSIVFHLRMSGRLALTFSKTEEKHTRLVIHLDDGSVICFINPRRLGTVQYVKSGFPYQLGLDPFSDKFTAKQLEKIAANSRCAIKPLLMDQRRIAGLGNIYSSEALWRVGIDPRRVAASLNEKEMRKLHRAIRAILREAIECMGTTFGTTVSDYRNAYGEYGSFQERLAVYGRTGEKCPRCGDDIIRIKQVGRSTFFCPGCQK